MQKLFAYSRVGVVQYHMEKLTIEKLREQETVALKRRAQLKQEIRAITSGIYKLRQKIKYLQSRKDKKPLGRLFEMFGKTRGELTPAEMREYHKALRKTRKKNM